MFSKFSANVYDSREFMAKIGCLCLLCPAVTLITLFPLVLNVAQPFLDFLDLGGYTHILAHIVAKLDSGTAIRSGDLDNDVEGLGFLSG